MTTTTEDWLREENERLRGKLEVIEAALNAAINKANWQAVTNKELSDTCAERDAAKHELAAYKQATDEFCQGGSEAAWLIIDRVGELLAANAQGERQP